MKNTTFYRGIKLNFRITSAYTGNTSVIVLLFTKLWNHPRLRGKYR